MGVVFLIRHLLTEGSPSLRAPGEGPNILQHCAPRFHCPAQGVPTVPGDAAAMAWGGCILCWVHNYCTGIPICPNNLCLWGSLCLALHPGVQESTLIQAWAPADLAWPQGSPGYGQVPSGMMQWEGDHSVPHTRASHTLGTCVASCPDMGRQR